MSDNNPFVVDSLIIDRDSFSRRKDLLPAGHNYAANANRGVGDATGFPDTQSVMYSLLVPGMKRNGLAADDVNMVKMAMTGVDRIAGTPDDYTVALIYDPDCQTADIQVGLTDTFITDAQQTGICAAFPRPSFSNSVHYSQTPLSTLDRILIELNPSVTWDFEVPLIFRGTFESGNLLEWSAWSQ
ncbi:MAG: hypothetical protein AAF604_23245 [Acidobacteriota bacterium]